MNNTFTLSKDLIDAVDGLRRDLGFDNVDSTIQYLLHNAVDRERKLIVTRLYQNDQKTMRQCAELLGVDLEEMINILRELHVSFNDDLAEQLEAVKKFTKGMQPA